MFCPYNDFMSSPAGARTRRQEIAIAGRPVLLLAWYDRHRRKLPWRPPAGERADPYRVWLSEIMLQQTGVKTVGPYFEKFLARWPGVAALGRASLDDVLRMWAGLGYYSRARNLHACAVTVLRDHGGAFPDTEAGSAVAAGDRALYRRRDSGDRLRPPHHAGRRQYRAGGVAAVCGGTTAAAGKAADPAIGGDAARRDRKSRAGDEECRAGDSAQALMDLGSSICTPKKPACALCPLNDDCVARSRGDQETLSAQGAEEDRGVAPGRGLRGHARRPAFGAQPPRKGPARRHDRSAGLGLARRAGRQDRTEAGARAEGNRALASQGRRRHATSSRIFRWSLWSTPRELPARARAPEGMRWVPVATLADEALPNVMRKAIAHGLGK